MRSLLPGLVLLATVLSGCSSGGSDDGGKVELTFWTWATDIEKVVDRWNATHPDIHVTVSRQSQGDELVTKVLTAAKAGNAPDLFQAEYQALPTFVSNDAVADLAQYAGDAKDAFAGGVWQQVTLGTEGVYAIPQDSGPMMLYYRADLFTQYGLTVPRTWDEFAQTARTLRAKTTTSHLTTFSANDPGWFAGLAQQAGAQWWKVGGDTWTVGIDDEPTRKVADYWGGLVAEGVIDDRPMYTPEWNKALGDGTLLAWPSAIWAPGVLGDVAAGTRGKWAMAPLPQWSAGENRTGNWGGSSTAVSAKSAHVEAAAEFAVWLDTDPEATAGLVTEGALYPAARDGQSGPALAEPPAFMPNQPDFYVTAKDIADTAAGWTWGPDVNVTYQTYKDAFGRAITDRTPFADAVASMQKSTVDDMRRTGFKVEE
ncbi:ABC transporter substrate-binding protein [Actinophytocola oryzae]|uniref:Multiple sugar transport system substrate-binding protein n=1 Tax=Actinophytocola oryzae TaxID=502181 RepID=A0A4R7W543_9PSEU|nr:extracellular solute-binding protein [Actinophytocola oryzae]TDV57208.1 multiple sugar transport system substrate-binding protein [Actinophytocola oryzae]